MRTKRKIVILIVTFVVLLILFTTLIVRRKRSYINSRNASGLVKSNIITNENSGIPSTKDRGLSFGLTSWQLKENGSLKKIDSIFMPILEKAYNLEKKEDPESKNKDETIEDELFRHNQRLISFKIEGKHSIGNYLFGLLRKTIDNICACSPPDGKKHETFGISSEHTALIRHYIKYFKTFVCMPKVIYHGNTEPEDIYKLHFDSINCFIGARLTKYHTASSFTKGEEKYMTYIEQFIDTEASDIPIEILSEGRERLSVKDHILYTLLHYICLFYSKSQETRDMLYTKMKIEKMGISSINLSKIINDYRYSDIVESIRPIHFVNDSSCIVKPLIVK
ncbi:uncharacterized protein Eint_101770 [Encephalitozoon intestinalis ATCC 50506]|uniref:Uncharacterized protein n=1 Tax=Encephalitozoon intestinalis (strain ATCC 50506) TaxID=876142 RepID=E0S9W7_ENCIT|nr:uncharacterized protein Eint_101770 [Encephalitozoon intestinalis ATCC 50506]ADM12502.1 hypothetical protein Eint_101770 [Encephalitozoon intestinalis ATCC 50506]UTX46339.1 putative exportin [Encephalitozoon intestinalis]